MRTQGLRPSPASAARPRLDTPPHPHPHPQMKEIAAGRRAFRAKAGVIAEISFIWEGCARGREGGSTGATGIRGCVQC